MRPALAALEEQQTELMNLRKRSTAQQLQIDALTRGITFLARHAGVEEQAAKAILQMTADVQNPAQPVPEPPSEPPTQTTQDAKTPEAMADVSTPGLVGGSTNDVAADATTTVYTPGQDIGTAALDHLVDVTRPVDGTQSPQSLDKVRTETDVRVGDPMNPQTAWPLRGDFANAQRTSGLQSTASAEQVAAAASLRTMSSLQLARKRIEMGMAQGDEFVEAASIEKDASVTQEMINRELATLNRVPSRTASAPAPNRDRYIPRAAGPQRSVPSLSATAGANAPINGSTGVSSDAEDIFL